MAVLFSSNDEDAIHRKIESDIVNQYVSDFTVEEYFEIARCCDWINSKNYSKVALQFPDSLLEHSAEISIILQKNTGCEIFILGDTSYGSCCVDEVTAEHVAADCIIHFGHACLSPTNRLPVLYIFGRKPIDIDNAVKEFTSLFNDSDSHIIICYEVFYAYIQSEFSSQLKFLYKNLIFASPHVSSETDSTSTPEKETLEIKKCGRVFDIPHSQSLSNYSVFYVGSESQSLVNLMLTFNKCAFFSYNPATRSVRQETLDVNKYLRKRYYFIERAKDAGIVGILVGTLGVRNYLTIIDHLRTIIKKAGKKAYTISVGKLNSAKLANFAEIEIFVYVSCAECSIVDAHEFYRPIVTPFEMEIACNQAREWSGDYLTDFSEILPGAAHYIPLKSTEFTDVSLVTGKLRSLGEAKETIETVPSSTDIAEREKMIVADLHSNAAGEFLANRIWKGLEQNLGQTPVPDVKQGDKGIASEYEGEGQKS